MRTKGQMSLEMIIGLLILLVVAVVVIRIFLKQMAGMEEKNFLEDLEFKQFQSECESICNQYLSTGVKSYAVKLCSHRFGQIGEDANRDGEINKFDPGDIGATAMWPICEDGIYCFHITDCKTSTGRITWGDCRRILCNAYYEDYFEQYEDSNKAWEVANEKVKELFPKASFDELSRVGSCMIDAEENWWDMYFTENPCFESGAGTTTTTTGGTTTTTSGALLNCQTTGTNIECTWSNCPTSVCNLLCTQNCGSEQLVAVASAGSYTYTTLTNGVTYTIKLANDQYLPVTAGQEVACC